MKLTKYERQVLMNQHAILELLSIDKEDKKYHATMKETYNSGYEGDYFEHGVYDTFLAAEECEFVYELINMYDDLLWDWNNNEELQKEIENYRVHFPGFDLNDEKQSQYYSYARFLILDQNRFHENGDLIRKNPDKLNSHGSNPSIDAYKRRIEVFRETNSARIKRDDRHFTVEEVETILNIY